MKSIAIVIAVILSLFMNFAVVDAQSSSANALYEQAQADYFSLKENPSTTNDPKAWQRVLDAYQRIIDYYPNDPIVDDIIFISGNRLREMYQLFGDRQYLEKAIQNYRTVLRDFPDSFLQQASLFAIAEVQETHLKSPKDALVSYMDLVNRFPNGYKSSSARDKISQIRLELGLDQPVEQKTEVKPANGSSAEPVSSQPSETAVSTAQPSTKPVETSTAETTVQDEGEPRGTMINTSSVTATRNNPALISDIRTAFGKSSGRVVIELNKGVSFKYDMLPAPNRRIYFDLQNVNVNKSGLRITEIPVNNEYLKKIRVGQFRSDIARVVLEFAEFRQYKVFILPAPDRIVFDLYGAGEGPSYVSVTDPGTTTGRPATGERPMSNGAKANTTGSYSLARQLGAKVATLVIDPGHGGKDPGTKGFSSLYEKNLNLDIARRVKAIVEKEMPHIKVRLTRESDTYLNLDQRPAFAKSVEADMFISIHSNSARKGKASGIETYYLNYASGKDAEEIAAKENALSSLNQAKLNDLVRRITFNSKKDESRELARFIQTNLYQQTKSHNGAARNRGVKSAPFVVLIGPEVPSILVEVGFINHSVEGKLLLQDAYRDKVAMGIFNGIKAYIGSLE